jgi:PAS domain S-box-containing protein
MEPRAEQQVVEPFGLGHDWFAPPRTTSATAEETGAAFRPSLIEYAMQQVDDAVAIATASDDWQDCKLVYVNSPFLRLTALAADTALEKPLRAVASSKTTSALLAHLNAALRETGPLSGEIADFGPDGKRRNIDWRITQIRDSDGSITHAIAVYRNISSQRQCEEALLHAERLASLGTLTAGVAHEVNNPLGAALLAADTALAAQELPDDKELLSLSLENVVASLERCRQIVRTLLRFARGEPNEKVSCDFNQLVRRSRDLARACADQQETHVDLYLDEHLPLVRVSPLEIEMVVVNLLHNAIQAGRHGIRIQVRTRRIGDRVRLAVEDNGQGMTDDEQQHAFEPLFSMRRRSGGTGLGLHIASRMVRENDGTISLQSHLGKGTVVTVELPVPDTGAPEPGGPT